MEGCDVTPACPALHHASRGLQNGKIIVPVPCISFLFLTAGFVETSEQTSTEYRVFLVVSPFDTKEMALSL